MVTLTYAYDDPEHPERITRAIQSPAYTDEDRALLAALEHHEADLCRCGHPKSVAWHAEMDGWFETETYVCHGCTARAPEDCDGKRQPVVYAAVVNTRPSSAGPLPPFELGVTTTRAA